MMKALDLALSLQSSRKKSQAIHPGYCLMVGLASSQQELKASSQQQPCHHCAK